MEDLRIVAFFVFLDEFFWEVIEDCHEFGDTFSVDVDLCRGRQTGFIRMFGHVRFDLHGLADYINWRLFGWRFGEGLVKFDLKLDCPPAMKFHKQFNYMRL